MNYSLLQLNALIQENVSLKDAIIELMQSAAEKDLIISYTINERSLTDTEQSLIEMM